MLHILWSDQLDYLIWLLESHKSGEVTYLTFEKPNCFTCSVHWSTVLT